MPIYEYVCQGCEARIEVQQKLGDPPLSTCERCGNALTKVISSPAIMFKGSGWYITDYSDKMKPPSEADNGKPGGDTKSSEAKPDDAKQSGGTTGASTTPASSTESSATGSSGTSAPPKASPSGSN